MCLYMNLYVRNVAMNLKSLLEGRRRLQNVQSVVIPRLNAKFPFLLLREAILGEPVLPHAIGTAVVPADETHSGESY